MNKENSLYGVIGLLAGAIIAGFSAAYAVNNNHNGMMNMMGMHSNSSSQNMMNDSDEGMTMNQMSAALKGKTGEDFDKAFIAEMITHHQGAITMATLAKQNAKHDEIKNLADAIITAQTNEINDMKAWQSQWGYSSSSPDNTHDMNTMEH